MTGVSSLLCFAIVYRSVVRVGWHLGNKLCKQAKRVWMEPLESSVSGTRGCHNERRGGLRSGRLGSWRVLGLVSWDLRMLTRTMTRTM